MKIACCSIYIPRPSFNYDFAIDNNSPLNYCLSYNEYTISEVKKQAVATQHVFYFVKFELRSPYAAFDHATIIKKARLYAAPDSLSTAAYLS